MGFWKHRYEFRHPPDYWTPRGGRISSSTDNGDTFPTFSLIDSRAKCPDALYVDGRLVVAWQQSLAQTGDELYVAVSEDHGLSFSAPVKVGAGKQLGCPRLVDNHAGRALVVWEEGFAFTARPSWVRSFMPVSGELGEPVQLTAPDEAQACSRLVSAPSGRVALVRSRGHSFERDWVTEVALSDDGGRTFGAPSVVDVIDPGAGCPAAGLAPYGDLYLAWTRDPSELRVSHGKPVRPCE